MNICIESHLLNHPRRSGVMTYTEGLVNGICAHDRENNYKLLYYSLRRRADDMPGPAGPNFAKMALRLPDQAFKGRQFIVDRVLLPMFFKKHKIDVFHRTAGSTIPENKKVFKILTVHDLRTLAIGDHLWKQNLAKYKKTLLEADLCVVVSECTKNDLLKHFQLNEQKIKVIYLGADKRFRLIEKQKTEAILTKHGINNRPYLLSIGSVPRKNIGGIIQGFAASKVKDDFLLILSCNYDVDQYRQLAKELGVVDKLLILEQLTDEEVVGLYNGCHAFVFPSLYEGFGLPILEAMQCGAPVITSNVSSCPEVAGDAAILVDPNNVAQISDAIDQVCRNQGLRQLLIKKGFQRAKFFSWDRHAEMMKGIYSMAQNA